MFSAGFFYIMALCRNISTLLIFCCTVSISSLVFGQRLLIESTYSQIYDKILKFELEEASRQLDKTFNKIQYHPESHALLSNYIDCLYLFVTEDKDAYDRLKENKKERLQQLANEANTIEAEYVAADIELQWAAVRFKFGDYFSAFTEVRRAYKSLSEIATEHPQFYPAQMRLSILEILIGTIPDAYQWGVRLIGLKGDIQQGFKKLDKAIYKGERGNEWYLKESLAAKAMLAYHVLNDNSSATDIIEMDIWQDIKGPLVTFLTIGTYKKTGSNQKSLDYLKHIDIQKEANKLPYLFFLAGDAHLKALDLSSKGYFIKFINSHKGDQYIKSAYLRMAWYDAIFKSKEDYLNTLLKVMDAGSNLLEEDKSAMKEAQKSTIPNIDLLKARLLFDGGYYNKAKQMLDNVLINHSSLDDTQLVEYYYRLGRIYDNTDEDQLALFNYRKVIETGRNNPAYYACNAALLSALIYENKKELKKAKDMFELCLKIRPDEYRTGLHQKAKAGLSRLNAIR